jgi:hypothetical protein
MRNLKDNRVHWSELHEMRKSAAHYRYACEHPRETTRPMRVGACFDAIVLGVRKYVVYDGDRRGKAWDNFEALHAKGHVTHAGVHVPVEIFTRSEWDDANGAAEAVLSDPVARTYLDAATKQVVMRWDLDGVPCAAGIEGERGGFDLLGETWIRDLKLTNCTEPEQLNRHIVKMGWHEQLVFYRHGARANGRDVTTLGIIAVESRPPYCVTCVRLSPELEQLGKRGVRSYIEKYKACEASGHWPGYVQSEVVAEALPWMQIDVEEEDDEA